MVDWVSKRRYRCTIGLRARMGAFKRGGREMDERVCELIELVELACAEHDLFSSCTSAPELLMVSGGSDSTAMCLLAAHLARQGRVDPSRYHVLHVDHGLRGEDSANDALFSERLAAQCGFAFHLRRIDVSQRTAQFGGNVESAARHMRYELAEELLDELCEQAGVPAEEGRICVAHTRDDRIETFFMRTIVGTGPGGFASIAFRNGRVVRPLLDASRSQLRDFIEAQAEAGFFEPIIVEGANAGGEFSEGARLGLWREDATNFGSEGFRAFVRNELIPLAKTRNPSLDETLSRTIDAIADENEMLQQQVEAALGAATREDGTFDANSLAELEPPLLRRAIYTLCKRALPVAERIERKHIDAIAENLLRDGFAIDLPGAVRFSNSRGRISLRAIMERNSELEETLVEGVKLAIPGAVELAGGVRIAAWVVAPGSNAAAFARDCSTATRVFLDAQLVSEKASELTISSRRPGETLQPLGMAGATKKLSDLLIDAKVDAMRRDEIPIVRAGDEIVWVATVAPFPFQRRQEDRR